MSITVLSAAALYFALAAMIAQLVYLKHTLALILIFVGAKIFSNQFGGHIPAAISHLITLSLLAGGILYSRYKLRGTTAPPWPCPRTMANGR